MGEGHAVGHLVSAPGADDDEHPSRLQPGRLQHKLAKIVDTHALSQLQDAFQSSGMQDDVDRLQELATIIKDTSLCGLGQTAPNPVLTTLQYFRQEYEAHITDHRCPALVCSSLLTYEISLEKCTGCAACVKVCPTCAISGENRMFRKNLVLA